MRVLVMEDDDSRLLQFVRRAKEIGASLDIAKTSTEAIRMLTESRYDLVLLDHDLGGRMLPDGREDCGTVVASFLEENHPHRTKHGPIVVHSLNGPRAEHMVQTIDGSAWIPYVWQESVWKKHIRR